MATLLLKKSYQLKDLREVKFNDLWNGYGIFTTMRIVGKSAKILLFKRHINNLLKSLKTYGIRDKNLKNKIFKIIKLNLKKDKNYDHLLRIALNKRLISISLRKRIIPNKNFKLKFLNYQRIDAENKNLKYKKILNYLKKINTAKYDIALHKDSKILETGTSNLLFVKNDKIFSPGNNCYKGTTLKFLSQKIKIYFKDIFLKNLGQYQEILIVGSGKGVVSVSSIEGTNWNRKNKKFFNYLSKIYNYELSKLK